MCHWTLRIWQCGESYFTKCSPCSFDRALHNPDSPLNPLHPSVTPFGVSLPAKAYPEVNAASEQNAYANTQHTNGRPYPVCNSRASSNSPHFRRTMRRDNNTIESKCPTRTGMVSSNLPPSSSIHARSAGDGLDPHPTAPWRAEPESVVLHAVALNGEEPAQPRTIEAWDGKNCGVFEVVLLSREQTVCPACARSPKRARLPAYARGIYAPS